MGSPLVNLSLADRSSLGASSSLDFLGADSGEKSKSTVILERGAGVGAVEL